MADKTPDIKLKADGTVDKRFMNSFVASQRAMTSRRICRCNQELKYKV
jgi:hypothetical protein